MRFGILSTLLLHPRPKKYKTHALKHETQDPVKSVRCVSQHFTGQKDGGTQAHRVIPAIFWNPSAYTKWYFLFENFLTSNKKYGLLKALCRSQGLVVQLWICKHLQTFHADVCACGCKRDMYTLVAEHTSAWLQITWIFGLLNPHNVST